ncbi:unnamed protein product [Rotaria sp. Silwood2]|nr:unnamed protein product [Rotaria sp. Silwood2]CAF4020329.1 unnamed protein product [Rotaria sp. Silwood2]
MAKALKQYKHKTNKSYPFNQLDRVKRELAQKMTFIPGEASDFYRYCQRGATNFMRRILEDAASSDGPTIDELNALQPNGSTALHAATYYGYKDIVELLLHCGCNRITLNRYGKRAYEEAQTPEMKKLFDRPNSTNRFHELDPVHMMALYIAEESTTNPNSNATFNYVHFFKSEDEILEHSLNQEATALWLKIYNWFTHSFRSFLQTDNFSVGAFDLQSHADFKQFVQNLPDPQMRQSSMKFIQEANRRNSIEPLITLYSSEEAGLYRPLNQQLACSPSEAQTSPHLCDRFVMEFYLKRKELKQRAFTGTVYRGATLSVDDVAVYELALLNDSTAVLGLKAFTSTSIDPLIALGFAMKNPIVEGQKHVLFVFEIDKVSSTIFAIEDISIYGQEREVLILPGTLFVVTDVQENIDLQVTQIVLRHWKVSFSFMTKLKQTLRSGKKSVI